MNFSNNGTKPSNLPEIIFSLFLGGTGGSETSRQVPGNDVCCTLVAVTAARGTMLSNALDFCCYSEASDKASLGSSASGLKLFSVDIDSALPSRGELVACITLV